MINTFKQEIFDSMLSTHDDQIEHAKRLIQFTEGRIYLIGNGASLTMADHFAIDLCKTCKIKSESLSNSAKMSAYSNDIKFDYIYSEQILINCKQEDLLIAISSSGESKNIINACLEAEKKEMNIITFTGFDKQNSISKFGDVNLYVSSKDYGVVECAHNIILHYIINELKK